MKIKQDFNSVKNQEIKGKFVQREVYTCFSYEMEAILRASSETSQYKKDYPLPAYEDIENLYSLERENIIYNIMADFDNKIVEFLTYSNDKNGLNRRCKSKNDFELLLNNCDDDEFRQLCEDLGYDCEDEAKEIYEWWIVSSFLAKKLKAQNQAIIEWGNNFYWGRETTGQAILLDGVISRICSDMEILENQQYDWSK
jgi:hypothetical protein